MASSTSKNKAPSVLKQSLITSGFILLLGIWCTISGKHGLLDNDENPDSPSEGDHQKPGKETAVQEKSQNTRISAVVAKVGRPRQWKVSTYDFSLALLPVFLVAYATLSNNHPDLKVGASGILHNWSGDIVGITWAISFIGYAIFAFIIIAFPPFARYFIHLDKGLNSPTLKVPWASTVALIVLAFLYITVPVLTEFVFKGDIVKESLVIMGFALVNTFLTSKFLQLPDKYRLAALQN